MIARLFPREYKGFYVDIGAADPLWLSVTKHFYDSGWSGVNVEPLPRFHSLLQTARLRDINLQATIGSSDVARPFFEIEEMPENSTSNAEVMEKLQDEGQTVHAHEIRVMSLEQVCREYVGDRQIDFMKIDVEGGEFDVLQSADWGRYRPVLLVVEAVAVNGREETWQSWEHIVTSQGYEKVWFDALNNYYLRSESLHLRACFRLPPNLFDDFQQARLERLGDEWIDQSELIRRIDVDRRAKQDVIDRLISEMSDLTAERQAKQEIVDHLTANLELLRKSPTQDS